MCTEGNHLVGQIGAKTVRLLDWGVELTAFEAKIDDFNIRGMRQQVEHPGWAQRFQFCPECGAGVGDLLLRELDYKS